MHLPPRMDPLETRRLFAFNASGASTITGTEFQSIDLTVALPGGDGFVSAGLFAEDSNLGTGSPVQPLGRSDVFLSLVKDGSTSIRTIGGDSRQKLRFDHDRADYEGDPARGSEQFLFGVDSRIRGGDEYVSDLAFGPDGKLYVALIFRRSISLDTADRKAPTLQGIDEFDGDYYDSAILRYDVSGTRLALERTLQIGGPFNDLAYDIDFDPAGNVYVGGRFERECDFGGSTLSPDEGRSAGFVAKYSRDLKLRYVSKFGGDSARETEIDAVYSIAVDADGSVFAGGAFAGDADFDPRGGKANRTRIEAQDKTDAFTLKLDADGGLEWVRSQGGDGYDAIKRVTLAPGGGVYNVGYFEDDADLDASPTARQQFSVNDNGDNDANTDLFFTRLDGDGDQIIVKPISGEGLELIASATTDSRGNLVLAGSFYGRADFDPSSRRLIRTSPDADVDDDNVDQRDNAYSGFVAVYSSLGKHRRSTQVDGNANEDVFITGASLDDDDRLSVAGRYRGGFRTRGDDQLVVQTRRDSDDTKEDGYSFVFDDKLTPIA